MFDDRDAHIDVNQVLDGLFASTAVPPGARGAVLATIDHLRTSSYPVEDVRRAERISVEIHKLESALRRSDECATQAARDEMKSLAAAWLQSRISSRH